jgi:ABC-type sugar transport system ATPase subunit
LARPGAGSAADAQTAPILQVEGLQQYYGGSHILRNVAFEAAAGEVTVILGRNGVGKTTLLKSLMGVVPVRSGTIRFGGADITRETPYQRARRGIGYVPQGREIFARLTVAENLQMGLATRRCRRRPPTAFELFPVLKEMLHRRGGDLRRPAAATGDRARSRPRRACSSSTNQPKASSRHHQGHRPRHPHARRRRPPSAQAQRMAIVWSSITTTSRPSSPTAIS